MLSLFPKRTAKTDIEKCQELAKILVEAMKTLKTNTERKQIIEQVQKAVCPLCGSYMEGWSCFCDLDR